MNTVTFLSTVHKYQQSVSKVNIIQRFLTWCGAQEGKRLLWTAIILPLQACIFAPLTFIVAMFGGVHFALFIPVITVLVFTFITNLAALPTKITIPVFIAGILIDIIVMIISLSMGVNPGTLF